MTDESKLPVTRKDGDSSLILSSVRRRLVARGRRDAEALTVPVEVEPENELYGIEGIHDFTDNNKSIEELLKDAEQGNAPSQLVLGLYYWGWSLTGSDAEKMSHGAESAKWCRRAAEQGYAPAQFRLGWFHHANAHGYAAPGVMAQDDTGAAKWFRLAADQGYAPAQFALGTIYDNGQGVRQDFREAVRWYRPAADQGHASAQFNLGLKYDKGQGVDRDFTEAVKWYRKAANQNNPSAQFSLGMKFNSGQAATRDYVQAYMWMHLAAANAGEDDRNRYTAIRDTVGAKMTPTQIAEAQLLAREWNRRGGESATPPPSA